MRRTVILVAGGKGLRMGGELPKQFIPLHGRPVLMHTMEVFFRWDAKAEQILVLPEEHQAYWQMLCRELNSTRQGLFGKTVLSLSGAILIK